MLGPQHNQAQRKGQKKKKENNADTERSTKTRTTRNRRALWRRTLKFSPFISRCEVSDDGININLI
jgi:hypothetical protein